MAIVVMVAIMVIVAMGVMVAMLEVAEEVIEVVDQMALAGKLTAKIQTTLPHK